ncbi:MAG: APC family permease [Chitinophagales bacterium]
MARGHYLPKYVWEYRFKRLIFGRPKRTDRQHYERLSVPTALAVFSADGLSSVAYATEEILWILVLAGAAAAAYSLPVGVGIVLLVLIVAASYTQTIHAYPGGGGSYIVSKDNLGIIPGLVAGASLLIDYVLTVAVSASAGVAALTSAFPLLRGHETAMVLASVWFIAWVNLRGVRESGLAFSFPTYSFIASILLLVGVGTYKALVLHQWSPPVGILAPFGGRGASALPPVTLFLLLRAFSSGCTALTGLEAVSNGVSAFRPPEDKHAIQTMKLERTLLYLMFAGITLLTFGHRIVPSHQETVLSQLARQVFGTNILYYAVQFTTALILLLAANTAYADFPRLAGFIARDGYLPRKLANRGDTLVFSSGIMLLAGLASVLIVVFRGSTHLLIPLYAVGVFTAFTLSQTGMVVHWLKVARQSGKGLTGHWWSIFINGLGAFLSGVVMVIITITKFVHGAWIVTLLVPLIVLYNLYIHDYYRRFKQRVDLLAREHLCIDDASKVKVVLTIGGLSNVIDHSLCVARRLSSDITAVYVAVNPEEGAAVAQKWDRGRHGGVNLVVLESPYRTVAGPLFKYLVELQRENPTTVIHLLMPIIVTNDPFDAYLHNGTADQVIRELRFTEGILLTLIPFFVDMSADPERVIAPIPEPPEQEAEEAPARAAGGQGGDGGEKGGEGQVPGPYPD